MKQLILIFALVAVCLPLAAQMTTEARAAQVTVFQAKDATVFSNKDVDMDSYQMESRFLKKILIYIDGQRWHVPPNCFLTVELTPGHHTVTTGSTVSWPLTHVTLDLNLKAGEHAYFIETAEFRVWKHTKLGLHPVSCGDMKGLRLSEKLMPISAEGILPEAHFPVPVCQMAEMN